MSSEKQAEETPDKEPLSLIIMLADTVRYLGIPGATIAFIMYMVLFWTTEPQRHEIIDSYVLFKGDQGHAPFTAAIVALIACNVITIGYYRKMIRMDQSEIARLNKWIGKLEMLRSFNKREIKY